MYPDYPFAHELPAPNGNFYPRDSHLYPRHCNVSLADPQGYAVADLVNDGNRLDLLRNARSERTTLTPEEDTEEAQLVHGSLVMN